MSAIPRVSSTNALAGRASQAWRNHQSAASNRRTSHEHNRPKSRCSSTVDLLGLQAATDCPAPISTSRSVTPLLPVTAGLSVISQQHADDTLSFLASLGAGYPPVGGELDDQLYPSWAGLAACEPVPDASAPVVDCIITLSPAKPQKEEASLASPSPAPAYELPTAPAAAVAAAAGVAAAAVAAAVPVKSSMPDATVAGTKPRKKPAPLCLAEEPAEAPGATTTLFRGVHDLTFVQELMDNLKHVQSLFRGVAANSTPAASAMAAARMLGRSLMRAEKRVRGLVADAAAVLLAPDAMHTLAEFGWVEVVAFDAACAKALGALEMEVHNLATGACKAFHRATPEGAWMQVGVARSPGWDIGSLLRELPSPAMVAPGDVCGPAAATSSPVLVGAGSSGEARKQAGLLSLADLADQLAASATSVQAAAVALQQWMEEQKAAAAAAVEGGLGGAEARAPVLVAAGAV